jgi:hypothetical protein
MAVPAILRHRRPRPQPASSEKCDAALAHPELLALFCWPPRGPFLNSYRAWRSFSGSQTKQLLAEAPTAACRRRNRGLRPPLLGKGGLTAKKKRGDMRRSEGQRRCLFALRVFASARARFRAPAPAWSTCQYKPTTGPGVGTLPSASRDRVGRRLDGEPVCPPKIQASELFGRAENARPTGTRRCRSCPACRGRG